MIRECFPTSVLLGSLESPVEASTECLPQSVESQTISACLCTSDLCNHLPGRVTASQAVTAVGRSRERVRCHQCGSLFSEEGNPDCSEFDEAEPSQRGLCQPGEVCLLYSWQKSR